jgi:Uma2 family endonuclease
MAAPPALRMTAREFIEDHPEIPDNAQLVHGEVVLVSAPARAHSRIAWVIFRALDGYVEPRGLGEVYGDGTGYELPPDNDTVRLPDVSFVRAGREPAEVGLRGIPRMAPDLAVEVLSPSDTPREVREKRDDYLRGGTEVVWLVDPDARGVEVWTRGAPTRWVGEDDMLDGAPVLPGFRLPVRDVFAGVARPA